MSEIDIASFKPKSEFVRVMQTRGYIHQCSDIEALDKAASEGVITAYIGFDATAPSLHVGSLIQIMMLRRLQQSGHRPLPLMGGGTTKVGDPSDKDSQRPLLTDAQIAANIAGIRRVFDRFLDFGPGPTGALMEDNAKWLDKLGYVDFLREYGVHFTINRMLTFDSVKRRLEREQPLTFLEFNYMLMQATDFLELNRLYGAALQMGGSDQWGNIINGVELIRRMDAKPAYALTTPLLTTASGAKMGKTVSGAVWLNADLLSPYDYWQFWRNAEDGDVGRFMKLFTDLPLDEIARYEALQGAEINEAKKKLADEATTLLHGAEAAAEAAFKAKKVHEEGQFSLTIEEIPFPWGEYDKRSASALIKGAGLANSLKEAQALITSGVVTINSYPTSSESYYAKTDILPDLGGFRVQVGRKKIRNLKPI